MFSNKSPLLAKVLFAIALGILCSLFMPIWFVRVFGTINSIFSNYLGFTIPIIILGLVAPSISDLGAKAGKLLIITTLIAYSSTIFSGYLSFFTAQATFPTLLDGASLLSLDDLSSGVVASEYFTIDMPPIMSVTSSLVLAFVLGLTLSGFKKEESILNKSLLEIKEVVMMIINKSIIPMLPIYIFGIFLKLGVEGQVISVLGLFLKVVIVIFVLHVGLLILQYLIAGALTNRSPLKAILNMIPAYVTALGTQSSAATIPVTLECVKKNGVKDDIAEFTVPLCATIHLSGSMLKIVACALAIAWTTCMPTDTSIYTGFIFMLAITMVAAPGVPGGAIMAAIALLTSQLGFDETQCGLMIALYIAMDSFGTACNVAGDGAIALIVNKFCDTEAK